jgi:hypothetical protein
MHAICGGLCILDALALSNDSRDIGPLARHSLCPLICKNHILVVLVYKNLGKFVTQLGVESIPSGYICLVNGSLLRCTYSFLGLFFGYHAGVCDDKFPMMLLMLPLYSSCHRYHCTRTDSHRCVPHSCRTIRYHNLSPVAFAPSILILRSGRLGISLEGNWHRIQKDLTSRSRV